MTRHIAPFLVLAVLAACGRDGATAAGDRTSNDGERSPPAVLVASAGVDRADVVGGAPVEALAAGFNDAGFDLLRTQPLESNLVFSPSSIGHALLLARAASDETTGAAIDVALGLPEGLAAHQAWNSADQQIAAAAAADEDVTVTVADRIWPRAGVQPDQRWIDLLAAQHGVDSQTLDLTGDPDGSRDTINGWVNDQTAGLIPELLPAGFIDAQTVLVLTDVLYFKARWAQVFGKYGPVSDVFTRLDGTTTPMEFMQELELEDRRGRGDGFVGAEIPYAGGEFSMLIIVPDEGRFAEIRDRLDQDLLDGIDQSFTTGPYELLLPKWEDTTQIDLLDWLGQLGIAPGSYPRIADGAFLDAAIHAADIAVDEWGTVAAAATGFEFAVSGPPEPELSVRADKPFLYLIRHRDSGLVLFAGQVTDPDG